MRLFPGRLIFLLFVCLDLCFVAHAQTSGKNLNNLDGWRIEEESGASLELNKSGSDAHDGLELNYQLETGDWVQIWRVLDSNIEGSPFLHMEVKGTGSDNTLQVKYVDEDGSTYGADIIGVLARGDWISISLGPDDFKYFWGGDKQLNKSRIIRMYIAITKTAGGSGKVLIRGIDFKEKGMKKKPEKKSEAVKPVQSSLSSWNAGGESGTSINLTSTAGKEGTALKIDYDMGTGSWVQIRKKFIEDLAEKRFMRFWLLGKGSVNNLQVKIEDMDGSTFGVDMEGETDAPVWQFVQIPREKFKHFWGGDSEFDWAHPKRLYFSITKYEGGAGSVLIDSIEFDNKKLDIEGPGLPADDTPVLIKMESVSGWNIGGESGTSFDMLVDEGHDGNSIVVDYDIGSGTWIQMQKRIKLNLEKRTYLEFYFKGEGAPNNLQVKLEDADGSTFGVNLEGKTAENEWQLISLPIDEMYYFWGGDTDFNRSLVKKLYFAITKGEEGGAGKVWLDEIRFVYKPPVPEPVEDPSVPVKLSLPKAEKSYKSTGERTLNFILDTPPIGFMHPWGGIINSIRLGPGKEVNIADENSSLLVQIRLMNVLAVSGRKEIFWKIAGAIFDPKKFWEEGGGFPHLLVGKEGKKIHMVPGGTRWSTMPGILLDLVDILKPVKDELEEQQLSEKLSFLVEGLDAIAADLIKIPSLYEWEKLDSGRLKIFVPGFIAFDANNPNGFYSASDFSKQPEKWKERAELTAEWLIASQQPTGLFPVRYNSFEDEFLPNRMDRQIQLLSSLRIALFLEKYGRNKENKKALQAAVKLQEFLEKSYTAQGVIFSGYYIDTGVPATDMEDLTVYALVVQLAGRLGKLAFAEHIMENKIIPSSIELSEKNVGFKPLDSSVNIYSYEYVQIVQAIQDYEMARELFPDAGSVELETMRYTEKPEFYINLEPYCNVDAISGLGSQDGDFDGVGFAFSSKQMPPSHTIFSCEEKDTAFVMPDKGKERKNAIQCLGQKIRLFPRNYKTIHILATAHHGNADGTVKLYYEDGSEKEVRIVVGDWWHEAKNGHLARKSRIISNGQYSTDRLVSLFDIPIEVNSNGNKVKVIGLPANDKICIFAISAQQD
ncbi:MAG: carbohydrate binding domain-containing protein [Candidatus Theseobacter exili]|nr:carbohydrate binding domain-containing protein [Candidatus Theseobacter exili]